MSSPRRLRQRCRCRGCRARCAAVAGAAVRPRARRSGVEASFVTRAVKDALVDARDHRARQVRALLAEGHELRGRPAAPAGTGRARWDSRRPARRQSATSSTDAMRLSAARSAAPPPPVLKTNPELADDEGCARQHHEFQEVAALDVLILRPVDRKVLAPGRLLVGGRAVGRDRDRSRSSAGVSDSPARFPSILRGPTP